MKIKKEYTYSNNRQIWRLLTSSTGKLIIEERDVEAREAFFNCIDVNSGKEIISGFQFDEKFWIGIETVIDDTIYFHKYLKPDMPQHKGIIAFDINSKKIVWENTDYNYLFVKDGKLYCYVQKFEGRDFFALNALTGELLDNGTISGDINVMREGAEDNKEYKSYLFPEVFYNAEGSINPADKLLQDFKTSTVMVGPLEYLCYTDLILMNAFEPDGSGTLTNTFRVMQVPSGKIVFEEVLNRKANAAVPDSFFMKNNKVFLLLEKSKVMVCTIK